MRCQLLKAGMPKGEREFLGFSDAIIKPRTVSVSCLSASSAMIMTANSVLVWSSSLQWRCSVLNALTSNIRDSSTSMAAV